MNRRTSGRKRNERVTRDLTGFHEEALRISVRNNIVVAGVILHVFRGPGQKSRSSGPVDSPQVALESTPEWFQTPKKVLFVLHPHIGDAVNLTAALRWMRQAWPHCHLVALTSPAARPILESTGRADEVWNRPDSWVEKLSFVSNVRKGNFDLAVFAYPQRSFLRLVRKGGARRVVGIRDKPSENWDFSVPERLGSVKVPGEVADLLSSLGCDCRDARPEVGPTKDQMENADLVLEGRAHPRVALHTGSSDPQKRWPSERFGFLAERALDQGWTPVFVGGSDEASVVAGLGLEKHVDTTGRLSLLETAAVLAKCDVLISGDSGPVHLAAAMGTPCLVLYGPTKASDHAPFGTGHKFFQCDRLDELAGQEVWAAVKEMLSDR